MGKGKLFPEHLEEGSPHRGAVAALQLWMKGLCAGLKFANTLEIDGNYGPETARVVAILQAQSHSIAGEYGEFNPTTKRAFANLWGVDFDALASDLFLPGILDH